MKPARSSVCFFGLLASIALGVHAQEPKGKATKPATSSAASAAKPAAQAASAAAEREASDDDFLEFLGSVDSDATDDEWLEYLAQTDILKVAKDRKKASAAAESQPAADKTGR